MLFQQAELVPRGVRRLPAQHKRAVRAVGRRKPVRACCCGAAAPPVEAMAARVRDRAGRHQPFHPVQASPLADSVCCSCIPCKAFGNHLAVGRLTGACASPCWPDTAVLCCQACGWAAGPLRACSAGQRRRGLWVLHGGGVAHSAAVLRDWREFCVPAAGAPGFN